MTVSHALNVMLAGLLLSAAAATPIAAQASDPIIVTEPDAWSRGLGLAATAGDSIRVRGVATHPAGVARIMINGADAELRRDPSFPNLVDFAGLVIASAGDAHVVIRLVPVTGEAVEHRYAVEVAAAAPAQRPVAPGAQQPPPTQPPPTQPLPRQPLPTQPRAGADNPWRPFMLRSLGYGALAGGGAALATMMTTESSERCENIGNGQDCYLRVEERAANRSAGLGLVGIAAVAALADAVRTSRRASATRVSSTGSRGGNDSPSDQRVQLDAPEITSDGARLDLALIRLRF